MRPGFAHRHNTAFARSSSLGEAHAQPVIKKVSVRRGNGHSRVIVKDGQIYEQDLRFRKYDDITFDAELIGRGYFYGTISVDGRQSLLFATPVASKVSHTISIEAPLTGLNFHISATIPTNLGTTYLDPKSRDMLKANPASYSSLGFIPIEPREGSTSSSEWGGKISDHSWKFGRSGTDITSGYPVKYWANYDGGWVAASAVYKYTDNGKWECIQQNSASLQVGTTHCIVGALYGYKDTMFGGGEYWPYTGNGRQTTNTTWKYADRMTGSKIRLMEHSARNNLGTNTHSEYGKNNYAIQSKGGKLKMNFNGSYAFDSEDIDKFCAKVEWWNPDTNEWSDPAIHPPWSTKITDQGRFAFYFRFPRQLTKEDEFYEKTPQWKLENTWDSYPRFDSKYKDTAPDYGVVYNRIGRPNVKGTDDGIEIEMHGKKLRTSKESPNYCVMIAPESKSDDGSDRQKRSYIPTSGDVVYQAIDPHAFSYSENPDITNAYWVNGNFKPGGSFMMLGKAVDFFPGLWVSTTSLAKKNNTPMDLRNTQQDLVRGSHAPNDFTADKITEGKMRKFKLTDVNDPVKVEKFLPSWEACFPGVPLTKEILIALLRGDQLPQLDAVENTKISGFLEDDPLRYEIKSYGTTFRHPWSLVYCEIPEGWWGPTIDEGAGINSVFIGGMNHYYFIKEERVDLRKEIEAQKAKEAAGATAIEAFADSELENQMVDITFEAYKNRNEVVAESVNEEAQDKRNWFFRTEPVLFKHKRFSLLGSVGEVTDVTERYSADQVTSLDGISAKNVEQYKFNDLYLIQGVGNSPSMVITPPKEPTGGTPLVKSNVSGFGNSERSALKSRALGYGNPMKYSTEDQQLGSIKVAPMGAVVDTMLGWEDGTIAKTATNIGWTLAGLGAAYLAIRTLPLANEVRASFARTKKAKFDLLESEARAASAVKNAARGR